VTLEHSRVLMDGMRVGDCGICYLALVTIRWACELPHLPLATSIRDVSSRYERRRLASKCHISGSRRFRRN
jgi:hypothetical protein